MRPKLLYVRLPPPVLEALCERAEAARRTPQDEAGLIIERALGLAPSAGGVLDQDTWAIDRPLQVKENDDS
jgi:hypothetical protein